uniref:Cs2 protein n=1 Tax=Schistosoma japonicum TaxID=6182 RepID=Q962D0_SCHJA|nr:Cs2 protein [Schistosoma japonicum]
MSSLFLRYFFMTEATSPPSLPSASSLSPCGPPPPLRLTPPPWELPPDPELVELESEPFLLRVEGGSSPKWTLSALRPPLTELARLLVDWALRMAGRMSEAASSRLPSLMRRRFWNTMGSDPRQPSPPPSLTNALQQPASHWLGGALGGAQGSKWFFTVFLWDGDSGGATAGGSGGSEGGEEGERGEGGERIGGVVAFGSGVPRSCR